MKIGILFAAVSLLFSLNAGAVGPTPGGDKSGNDKTAALPDGYMAGRDDARYGTYSTVIQPPGRSYQERMMFLENKAFGLAAHSANADNVQQSEAVYLLENEVIRLYTDVANAPETSVTTFERFSLLANTVRTYQHVRHHAERLYENMIRYIDHALPGPNGLQIREETSSSSPEALYYPNYRSDKDLTDAEKKADYDSRVEAFLKKGGSWSEIKTLTPKLFRNLPSGVTYYEYVWLENGQVQVTEGKAGHILLARGGAVKSAGQLVFIKDAAGKYPMMIVTNASGSFKPDILSAEELKYELEHKLGINPDLSVVTKGEPLSTQAVKVYLKGKGTAPEEISRAVKALEAEGRDILLPPAIETPECAGAFSQAS